MVRQLNTWGGIELARRATGVVRDGGAGYVTLADLGARTPVDGHTPGEHPWGADQVFIGDVLPAVPARARQQGRSSSGTASDPMAVPSARRDVARGRRPSGRAARRRPSGRAARRRRGPPGPLLPPVLRRALGAAPQRPCGCVAPARPTIRAPTRWRRPRYRCTAPGPSDGHRPTPAPEAGHGSMNDHGSATDKAPLLFAVIDALAAPGVHPDFDGPCTRRDYPSGLLTPPCRQWVTSMSPAPLAGQADRAGLFIADLRPSS